MTTKEAKKVLRLLDQNLLDNVYEKFFITGGMEELYICFADFIDIPYQKINEKNIKTLFNAFVKDLDKEKKDNTFFSLYAKKTSPNLILRSDEQNQIYIPPPQNDKPFLAVLSPPNNRVDTLCHFKEIMAQIKEKRANLENREQFVRSCCKGLAKGVTFEMDYRVGSGFIARFWDENKDILDKALFVCQFVGYRSIPINFRNGGFSRQFILTTYDGLLKQRITIDFNSWQSWFVDLTGDRRDYLVSFYNRKLGRLDINQIFRDFYEAANNKHDNKEDLYRHFDRWFAKLNFKYFPQSIDN